MKFTDAQQMLVVNAFAGTSDSMPKDDQFPFEISQEQIEEIMAENEYERCPECEWWVENSELVDEDNEETTCDGCGNQRVD